MDSLLQLSPPSSSTVFSSFDGLEELLSPSLFNESLQDIWLSSAASAQRAPSTPLTIDYRVAVPALADENASLSSTRSASVYHAGSPARVQRRRSIGYSGDDFNLIRNIGVGELSSAARIWTSTAPATSSMTTPGAGIHGSNGASTDGGTSTAGADPERALMAKMIRSRSPDSIKRQLAYAKVKHAQNMASESMRRKRMTRLFHTLRSLLPSIDIPQSNRCCVIDETCRYIRDLEKKLRLLKLCRANILYLTTKSELLVNECASNTICGGKDDDACKIDATCKIDASHEEGSLQLMPAAGSDNGVEAPYVKVTCVEETMVRVIVGCYERGPCPLFSTILHTLESKGLDVINANRSQVEDVVLYSIHACLSSSSKLDFRELEELIFFTATHILKDFVTSKSI